MSPHVTHQVAPVAEPLVALRAGELALVREAGRGAALAGGRLRAEGRGDGGVGAALAAEVEPRAAPAAHAVQPRGPRPPRAARVARVAVAVAHLDQSEVSIVAK